MRWLLAFGLMACATSRSSESETHLEQARTVTRDEGTVTIKTWEYEPTPKEVVPSADERRMQSHADERGMAVTQGAARAAPAAGPLIRYTEETHSPVKTIETSDTRVDAEAKAKSTLRVGLSLWTKLALGVAAVAALALLWRFRRALGIPL